MATKIEWTDETWNPITGCSKVSAGCAHCYAERVMKRFWPRRKFADIQLHEDRLLQPMHWKKPRRVFVNSMSDLFHESVPDEFIDKVFAVMALCPQHTFQILTKRAGRMVEYMKACNLKIRIQNIVDDSETWDDSPISESEISPLIDDWPLPNVWLGVSAENQEQADKRISQLLKTPAALRFVSAEPLLSQIILRPEWLEIKSEGQWMNNLECGHGLLRWVICGGESGPKARFMHPEWVRALRDQCQASGVPFFFKQWGEWRPPTVGEEYETAYGINGNPPSFLVDTNGNTHCFYPPDDDAVTPDQCRCAPMIRAGKKRAGRLLDGATWDQMPEGK